MHVAPTLENLKKHATTYGPEGILESADHLSEEEQAELKSFIRSLPKPSRPGRRRS